MKTALLIASGLLASALGGRASGPPEIRLEGGRFAVHGWAAVAQLPPERWKELFSVFVDAGAPDRPPLLGSYRLEAGAIVFEPRFPLQPGLRYRVVLKTDPPTVAGFEIPRPDARAPTRVAAVFPSTERLPENQLKLYIHFSAPMSRGEVYQRVRLLDARGDPVELPFLELEQELWDAAGKRLTLLFDPGRVKRDLVPHQEVGPPLKAGQRYTLFIDPGWPDAGGAPLAEAFRKEFTAVAADRTPPDLAAWRLTPPRARTSAPLLVDFPDPMDHALLERLLAVHDAADRPVPGTAAIELRETRWRFIPDQPWRPGAYALLVDTAIEDLAGNRVGRPFDVDLFEHIERQTQREIRSLPFHVR